MVYELIIENNIYYKIIYININKQKNIINFKSIILNYVFIIKII